MRRIIQVRSKRTGKIYELITNTYEMSSFDVLEFHGIARKPGRICDRERGYSLFEKGMFLEDEDFEVIKDEEDHTNENRLWG